MPDQVSHISPIPTPWTLAGAGTIPTPQEDPPAPIAPSWTPEIEEPEPDLLPDEIPLPNPDENDEPGRLCSGFPAALPRPIAGARSATRAAAWSQSDS